MLHRPTPSLAEMFLPHILDGVGKANRAVNLSLFLVTAIWIEIYATRLGISRQVQVSQRDQKVSTLTLRSFHQASEFCPRRICDRNLRDSTKYNGQQIYRSRKSTEYPGNSVANVSHLVINASFKLAFCYIRQTTCFFNYKYSIVEVLHLSSRDLAGLHCTNVFIVQTPITPISFPSRW